MNPQPWRLFRVFSDAQTDGNIAAVSLFQSAPVENYTEEAGPASVMSLIWRDGGPGYRVRWQDRHGEVQRCGHGALAAAAYLFEMAGAGSIHSCLRSDCGEQWLISASAEACRVELPPYGSLKQTSRSQLVSRACGGRRGGEMGGQAGYVAVELPHLDDLKKFAFPAELATDVAPAALIISVKAATDLLGFRYFRVAADRHIIEDSATGSAIPALLALHKVPPNTAVLVRQYSPGGGVFHCRLLTNGAVALESKVTSCGPVMPAADSER